MPKSTNVRIKEIAQRLDLSVGTVSVVLNGRGDAMRISKATQERVRAAADEMNYQPNIYARRLRNTCGERPARAIGVFWNYLYADEIMSNVYRFLQEESDSKEYRVEFSFRFFHPDQLHKDCDIITSQQFNGIIIYGISDADEAFLNESMLDLPIVVLLRRTEKLHSICLDDYAVGQNVARLFMERGHRNAGFIGSKQCGRSATLRRLGFLEQCKQYDIRIQERWIKETPERDHKGGYLAMQEILQEGDYPSVLFVSTPQQVIGIINFCQKTGILIPRDLELLAYGEYSYFDHLAPTISCVYLPMEYLAGTALDLLITVLDKNIQMPINTTLREEYQFRESCGGFLN